MNADYGEFILETIQKTKSWHKLSRGRGTRASRMESEAGFQCRNCGFYVLAEPLLSGVRNRNHCPYCLWSRCLDLFEAGDRLSPCKAPMQPVGLALKKTRKKYGAAASGELMIVHHCTECGKASANRIAADDDPEMVYELYLDSMKMSVSKKDQVEAGGVILLEEDHRAIVRTQLFGKVAEREVALPISG
jgi:RNHCP domain